MPIDYAALASEINVDPAALGYAAPKAAHDGVTIAAIMDAVGVGASFQVFRGVIPSYEIINSTVPAEWAALSAAEKQRYQTITGAGQVDTTNQNIRDAFLAMFAAGTATRTALIAMAKRQGSRAEVLFGVGVSVSHIDVKQALGW